MREERRADSLQPYRLTAGRRGKRVGGASAALIYRPPLPRDPREPDISDEGGEGETARWVPPPIGRAGARDWRRCSAPHLTGMRAGLGVAGARGGLQASQSGAGKGLQGFCRDVAAQLCPGDGCACPEVFNVQMLGVT